MNNEILKNYFTDPQMAEVLDMSLGGMRNKLYRGKADELPACTKFGRMRLWQKDVVRNWLLKRLAADTVEKLMDKGDRSLSCQPVVAKARNTGAPNKKALS